jgi:hypothetical protein
MVQILTWLFETAPSHLPVSEPPPNTSKQSEVSNSDYLLFSVLLKPHHDLSEKGQSSHGAKKDPMAPILAELVRLGTHKFPSSLFVGSVLFTCYESR